MDTAAERQAEIRKWLQEQEFLSVSEACRRAEASPATIRRDFAQLVAEGVAERHRGGVRRQGRDALAMVPFAEREMRQAAEKSAIARAAAALLEPGDAVFVDGGTSTLHLASHLGAVPVRIITNSLRLAVAVGERPTAQPVEVHLSGGYLLPRSGLLIGPQARATIAGYHTRWAFLSVGGVGPDGVYNTDGLIADIEQTMIANCERAVVLADHTKLAVRSLCHVAPLSRIALVITDAAADPAAVAAIRAAGVTVQVAEQV
jgi:DeoR/GlpR family transcriptional regulator of sugar metabolism